MIDPSSITNHILNENFKVQNLAWTWKDDWPPHSIANHILNENFKVQI